MSNGAATMKVEMAPVADGGFNVNSVKSINWMNAIVYLPSSAGTAGTRSALIDCSRFRICWSHDEPAKAKPLASAASI
jgi:hypothetical protein